MRIHCLLFALAVSSLSSTALSETLEVTIHGMTCSFCADGLRRNLAHLTDVQQVDVSLKHKKVRIRTKSGVVPDIDLIRQAVRDAGFTPVDVRTIPDAD